MPDEDRALMQQLEVLQTQMQQAERTLGQLEAEMMDAQRAIATLEAVSNGEADGAVLVPIGGGVQLRARIERQDPVLVALGSETAVDGSLQAALSTVGTRRDRVRQAFEQTAARLNEMARVAQQLQQRLSSGPE